MSVAYLPPPANVQAKVGIWSIVAGVFIALLAIIFTISDHLLSSHNIIWSFCLYSLPLGSVSCSLISYQISQIVKTKIGLYLGIFFAVILPLPYISIYLLNAESDVFSLILFAFLSLPLNISGLVFLGRYLFNSPSMESAHYRRKFSLITLICCLIFLASFLAMLIPAFERGIFEIMFFQLYFSIQVTVFSLFIGLSNRRFLARWQDKALLAGTKVENSTGLKRLIYSNIVLSVICFIVTAFEVWFIMIVMGLLLFFSGLHVY